jgi:hypothetical protein
MRLPSDLVWCLHTLAQLKSRQHRPAGVILLRRRRPKQRHEALAGDLGEGALIALHCGLGQRQHVVHQMVHRLRP